MSVLQLGGKEGREHFWLGRWWRSGRSQLLEQSSDLSLVHVGYTVIHNVVVVNTYKLYLLLPFFNLKKKNLALHLLARLKLQVSSSSVTQSSSTHLLSWRWHNKLRWQLLESVSGRAVIVPPLFDQLKDAPLWLNKIKLLTQAGVLRCVHGALQTPW